MKKRNGSVIFIWLLICVIAMSTNSVAFASVHSYSKFPVVTNLDCYRTWNERSSDLYFMIVGEGNSYTTKVEVYDSLTEELLAEKELSPTFVHEIHEKGRRNSHWLEYEAEFDLDLKGFHELEIKFYFKDESGEFYEMPITSRKNKNYIDDEINAIGHYYISNIGEEYSEIDLLEVASIDYLVGDSNSVDKYESIVLREYMDYETARVFTDLEIVLRDMNKMTNIDYMFTLPDKINVLNIEEKNSNYGILNENHVGRDIIKNFAFFAVDTIKNMPITAIAPIIKLISNTAGESSLINGLNLSNLGKTDGLATYTNTIYSTSKKAKYTIDDNVTIKFTCDNYYGEILAALIKDQAMSLYVNYSGDESILGSAHFVLQDNENESDYIFETNFTENTNEHGPSYIEHSVASNDQSYYMVDVFTHDGESATVGLTYPDRSSNHQYKIDDGEWIEIENPNYWHETGVDYYHHREEIDHNCNIYSRYKLDNSNNWSKILVNKVTFLSDKF